MLNKGTYRKTMERLKMIGINTRDHEAVVQKLAEEIGYYRDKIQRMEQAVDKKIVYVCDHRKCESCISVNEFCGYTSDISSRGKFSFYLVIHSLKTPPLSNKR